MEPLLEDVSCAAVTHVYAAARDNTATNLPNFLMIFSPRLQPEPDLGGGPVRLEGNYNFMRVEPIGSQPFGQEFRDGSSNFLSNPDNSASRASSRNSRRKRYRTQERGHQNVEERTEHIWR